MRVWELWLSFIQIGFFSIGGGYATIPLIQQKVVEQAGWLSQREFTDIITISQMTPGPLAVNASTFVGIRLGGVTGALVATIGCVASGLIISWLLYRLFTRGDENYCLGRILDALKAASVGLIAAAAATILVIALFGMGLESADGSIFNFAGLGIFIVCIVVLRWRKAGSIAVMLLSGLAGLLLYW